MDSRDRLEWITDSCPRAQVCSRPRYVQGPGIVRAQVSSGPGYSQGPGMFRTRVCSRPRYVQRQALIFYSPIYSRRCSGQLWPMTSAFCGTDAH